MHCVGFIGADKTAFNIALQRFDVFSLSFQHVGDINSAFVSQYEFE